MNRSELKIGLFGIGLETYWKQFDGLKKDLKSISLKCVKSYAIFMKVLSIPD